MMRLFFITKTTRYADGYLLMQIRRHTFMKIYTENFIILLNKHITNKEIDAYEFRAMYYLLTTSLKKMR